MAVKAQSETKQIKTHNSPKFCRNRKPDEIKNPLQKTTIGGLSKALGPKYRPNFSAEQQKRTNQNN